MLRSKIETLASRSGSPCGLVTCPVMVTELCAAPHSGRSASAPASPPITRNARSGERIAMRIGIPPSRWWAHTAQGTSPSPASAREGLVPCAVWAHHLEGGIPMRIAIRSPLRAFLVIGGLAGALALLPEWGAAQSSVTITGQVTNPQGEPLRDANVSIFDLSIGVWTGPDGAYRLIVPGARADGKQVRLGARLIGYRGQSFTITLTPGGTLAQDFQRVSDPL